MGFARVAADCPGSLGTLVALTGYRIASPADLLYLGLATHFVPTDQLPVSFPLARPAWPPHDACRPALRRRPSPWPPMVSRMAPAALHHDGAQPLQQLPSSCPRAAMPDAKHLLQTPESVRAWA